jgi:predicted enzyme related to lactoylglutathione lyase
MSERRFSKVSAKAAIAVALVVACCASTGLQTPAFADAPAVGVGPQYDTSHVYVAPQDLARFTASFVATFGGKVTQPSVLKVTPTPSLTTLQAALTPVGLISAFGFKTPIPYPFGAERTGYLVADFDAAIEAAKANGASIVVAPFDDPIGRDAIVQWPGGVFMQFYRHTTESTAAPLATVPDNRVYLSPDRAEAFVHAFVSFSQGKVTSDDPTAPGIEIGRSGDTYRRIRIESAFGKTTVLVTDGQLPYPYGRETTGYEVSNLSETLAKAEAAGASVLVTPFESDGRDSAIVEFPGGYIAEIHAFATNVPHASR